MQEPIQVLDGALQIMCDVSMAIFSQEPAKYRGHQLSKEQVLTELAA